MSVYILNFQGPEYADDLAYYYDRGGSNINSIITDSAGPKRTAWTVPKNAVPGDIAIVACARTAAAKCGHARAEVKQNGDAVLLDFADEQVDLYKIYSGKIIAVGIIGGPYVEQTSCGLPMRYLENLRMLSRPVDTKELNGIIKLNQFGSVTVLDDKKWAYLKDYINSSELKSQVEYMDNLNKYIVSPDKATSKGKPKSPERDKMSARLRYEVMRRDGFRCVLCGRTAEDGVKLHVDHIRPISQGGLTEYDNLRTLCEECNLGKGPLWNDDGVN